jgi:hypothetical protein
MIRFFAVLLLFLSSFGCTEEKITAREYPRVQTREAAPVSNSSLKLEGEIFFASVPIIDHGFVWSESGFPTITNGTKFSLGPKDKAGIFEATASTALTAGKTYSARAYAQSTHYVVYGEIFEFVAP